MKRADIEGLRALSIVLVFAYHLSPSRVPGGFIGVDIFFVISGFLITQHLFREAELTGRIRSMSFYGRRIRRLLPASFLVLLFSLAVTAFVLPASNAPKFAGGIAASAVYVSNWFLALTSTGYSQIGSDPSIVQQYWSLSVEEQFYLVWPWLFLIGLATTGLFLRQRANSRLSFLAVLAVVFGGSLVASIYQSQIMPEESFFSTLTRAWEFALGGLIAFLPSREKVDSTRARRLTLVFVSWVSLGIIVSCAFTFSDTLSFPGWIALLPVVATAILIGVGDLGTTYEPAYLSKFTPVLFVGGISYSIYLWHWPLIVTAQSLFGRELTGSRALVIIAVTLVLATVTKYCVEDPLRFGRLLGTTRRAISFAVVGALVIVSLSFAVAHNAERAVADAGPGTGPFTGVEQISDAIDLQQTTNTWIGIDQNTPRSGSSIAAKYGCYAVDTLERLNNCFFGPPEGDKLMLVIGDSFADMYAAGIVAGYADSTWRILPIDNSTCPASDFVVPNKQLDGKEFNCTEFQAWRFSQLLRLKPDAIVVANNSDAYRSKILASGQNWSELLVTGLIKLKTVSPAVVVIGQPPFTSNCPTTMQPDQCPDGQVYWSLYDSEMAAVRAAGFPYIDTNRWFCDTSRVICPEAIDGTYVHRALEDPHLSDEYSVRLSHLLRESIDNAISEQNR